MTEEAGPPKRLGEERQVELVPTLEALTKDNIAAATRLIEEAISSDNAGKVLLYKDAAERLRAAARSIDTLRAEARKKQSR